MERKEFNKKGAEMALNKTILLVLGLIVFVAFALFLFRSNINDWIQNLPGYKVPEDRAIDIDKIDSVAARSLCPLKVAKLLVLGKFTVYSYSKINLESTKGVFDSETSLLYYDKYQRIELDENINEIIATLTPNGDFVVDPVWFSAQSHVDHPKLPSKAALQLIDGAYLRGNYLCKSAPAVLPTTSPTK